MAYALRYREGPVFGAATRQILAADESSSGHLLTLFSAVTAAAARRHARAAADRADATDRESASRRRRIRLAAAVPANVEHHATMTLPNSRHGVLLAISTAMSRLISLARYDGCRFKVRRRTEARFPQGTLGARAACASLFKQRDR